MSEVAEVAEVVEVVEQPDLEFEQKLDKTKFTVFRLDGHSFSRFTSCFTKPFDSGFTTAMKKTAETAFTYYNFSHGF
jgi:tRNA(His) 5'-end guanylyltransferase